MDDFSFHRLGDPPPAQPVRYQWVTVQARPGITDNQHPGAYVSPLFENWIKDGWEVVSVTVFDKSPGGVDMCRAIGVLRRPHNGRGDT